MEILALFGLEGFCYSITLDLVNYFLPEVSFFLLKNSHYFKKVGQFIRTDDFSFEKPGLFL